MGLENKIKIIDEIVKRHPSYGIDIGWSYYVGGMADTGNWYFRKMLDEPVDKLQSFLDKLISIENQPQKEQTESQDELKLKFFKEVERRLLWGK